jgi:hypothetical protein
MFQNANWIWIFDQDILGIDCFVDRTNQTCWNSTDRHRSIGLGRGSSGLQKRIRSLPISWLIAAMDPNSRPPDKHSYHYYCTVRFGGSKKLFGPIARWLIRSSKLFSPLSLALQGPLADDTPCAPGGFQVSTASGSNDLKNLRPLRLETPILVLKTKDWRTTGKDTSSIR